jgi:hypothetical protein
MNGSRRVAKHQLHGNLADRMRNISLRELLRWHGFEIKPEGITYRAKNERYNIVVTGNRWFDNKAGVGGVGAIDLQMHLTGEDFAAACRTLATDFRAVPVAKIGLSFPIVRNIRSQQDRRPFHELAARYAVPSEAKWPITRAYLVETRGIDSATVDDLQAVGTIFANDHRPNPSIVFLHRTQHGKVEGATLRDIRHESSFRPCLGNKLTAWFTVGHPDTANTIVAVESPIDALSYNTIHACCGDALAIVSCAGALVPNELMRQALRTPSIIRSGPRQRPSR